MRSELAARLLLPVRSAWIYVVCAVLGVFAAWRHKGRDAVDAWLAVTIGCVLVLLTIAVLVPLWRTVVFGEPRYRAYSVDSIAHTWPFCIALVLLPLASPDVGRDRLARYLCLAAALMIIGALAIVPTAGGAQWSPRYLFAAAPLLAVVASAPAHRAFRGPAALVLWTARAVLLCSAVAQVDGLRLLIDAKSRNARITHRLADLTRPGDVVISDAYWFLQVTAELIPSRRMLLAWSPDDVGQAAALAAKRGIRDVAVASSSAETGYRAPRSLDASAEGCVFTRNVRLSLGERGLIVHRYSCGPGAVVK